MNYQFITENLQQNRRHKIFVLVLFVLFSITLSAQQIIPASVLITEEWSDKNGKNILTIDGRNLCNLDSEYGAVDGFQSSINVNLKNDNQTVSLQSSLTEEECMMQTWLIREQEIWLSECDSVQIVFIPLFYCGNADSDTRISYVIFYGGQKLFVHINYLYEFSADGYFRLNDDLKKKVNFVKQKKLRAIIIEQLKTKYTNLEEYENVFAQNCENTMTNKEM